MVFIRGNDGQGPSVKPLSLFGMHVDAAMAFWTTKIVVPVGSMERNTGWREERHPGHTGQLICIKIGSDVPVPHVATGHFDLNPIATGRGDRWNAVLPGSLIWNSA